MSVKLKLTWPIIAVWFGAALLLIYDGIIDTMVSTNHPGVFDIMEAVIGIVLLCLLLIEMRREW